MKRTALVLALAAHVVAGCGSQESGSLGPAPSAAPAPPSPPAAPASPSPTPSAVKESSFQVWFAKSGKLFVATRSGPETLAVARRALDSLKGGPSSDEVHVGVTSAVSGADRMNVELRPGGLAVVGVDPAFFDGPAHEVALRRAQVVYTLTQFSTIRRVRFSEDPAVLTRHDFDELLPQIVVESPVVGAKVSSPVTVSGIANVFEATVSMRVLDAGGRELARAFTTATCGTGCWGTYSGAIRFAVGSEQRGTIEVYESSAEDGSPLHLVSIPVMLAP
jgi:hypothetical protein